MSWGPSHQQVRRRWPRWRFWLATIVFWFLVGATLSEHHAALAEIAFYLGLLTALIRGCLWIARRRGRTNQFTPRPSRLRLLDRFRKPSSQPAEPPAAGVHLGISRDGQTRRTTPEHAVLLLGPPRSGKTSAVIIPTLLTHPGAAVSTSTKPDVMRATHTTRQHEGRVWQFDPTGTSQPVDGVQMLRWSPVLAATEWDGALLMARAMVTGAHVGHGTTDQSHWTRRAQALLAPLLHAAAVSGRQITDVVEWTVRHEIDEPGALLKEHNGNRLAAGQLIGLANTEGRERSSIFSAAADALDAYSSQAALDAATNPNFFTNRFVTSSDTVYIHAPAEHQQLAAPLVCGLLAEIRRATYQHHRDQTLRQPVLFALDEVANIAPITELPQIASEGGSQGILLLAALQDLSQARARWGPHADGFLTLFGTKLLLPGIADQQTLEAVSTALGEYDRRMVSHNQPNTSFIGAMLAGPHYQRPHSSTSYSTQRQRRVPPGDIARLPHGKALLLRGVRYELVALTPAHTTEPWRTLTTPTVA